jgi:hypothetical protein
MEEMRAIIEAVDGARSAPYTTLADPLPDLPTFFPVFSSLFLLKFSSSKSS